MFGQAVSRLYRKLLAVPSIFQLEAQWNCPMNTSSRNNLTIQRAPKLDPYAATCSCWIQLLTLTISVMLPRSMTDCSLSLKSETAWVQKTFFVGNFLGRHFLNRLILYFNGSSRLLPFQFWKRIQRCPTRSKEFFPVELQYIYSSKVFFGSAEFPNLRN